MEKMIEWQKAEQPERTASYSPIGHLMLVQMITERLEQENFKIVDNRVTQSLNGQEISGHMTINGESEGSEYRHMVAYTNSYNKRIPIRIVSGAEVFICLNGMIVGEIVSLRKHTGNIELEADRVIVEAIGKVKNEWIKTAEDVEVMKAVDLTKTLTAELIGRIYAEEQILTSREVAVVVKEFQKPTFPKFEKNNLWSLYNHCTYSLKESRVDRKIPTLKRLHEFTMDVAGELVEVAELPY